MKGTAKQSMPRGERRVVKSATTVAKVCRIIDEFSDRKSLGITDLSRLTALLPSDVHRILASLRANGYIDQDPETKKYQLGFALLRLGLAACQRNKLYEAAHPILVRISQQIEATTHFGALDGRELQVVLIDDVSVSVEDRFRSHLGKAERLHCTALGKTIIANLERHTVSYALEKSGMMRSTGRTITDFATLEKQFKQVREQGYAVDRDECFDGISCIGCAVRDYTGGIVGAVSTSMTTSRFLAWDESRLAAYLKAGAFNISAALGAY